MVDTSLTPCSSANGLESVLIQVSTGIHLALAVQRDGQTLFELQFDVAWLIRGLVGRDRPLNTRSPAALATRPPSTPCLDAAPPQVVI